MQCIRACRLCAGAALQLSPYAQLIYILATRKTKLEERIVMFTARLWFARLVVVYGVLVFGFLTWIYTVAPLNYIEMFGVSANGVPESIAFFRVTVAALFAGQAIVAAWGLLPGNLLNSLKILVLFLGLTVAMRVFGIVVDGLSETQISELRNEGISWLFFVVALITCPRESELRNTL